MWGVNKKEVKSNFFEGINFIKKSFGDFFEQFINAIQKAEITQKQLNVPICIVIGSESCGKSSLLENIVKCQLFPKDTSFCTKIPIHLILKGVNDKQQISYKLFYNNKEIKTTKENICKEIEKIMEPINDDVLDDTIEIEICEFGMIDFEFYDLPGIRAYPPKLYVKTTNIAKKYLSMENVIPICVIPATTPRITSYIPMALIKEKQKEKDTIICLTMCDRLQNENIEELLINRITLKTDEYDSNTFSGICGVINRTHKNQITLKTNDDNEIIWFKETIFDCIPPNFSKENKKLLSNNLGIENMIKKLSNCYKRYVSEKWIPSIILNICDKQNKLEDELNNIGFNPTDEQNKCKFNDILFRYLNNYFEKFMHELLLANIKFTDTTILDVDKFIEDMPINNLSVDITKYLNFITQIDAFDADKSFIIKINRFEELNNCIVNMINTELTKFNKIFIDKYIDFIRYDCMTCGKISEIVNVSNCVDKTLNKKMYFLFDNYIKEFCKMFIKNLSSYDKFKTAMKNLTENSHNERLNIENKLNNFSNSIKELQTIKIIEDVKNIKNIKS